MLRNQILIAVRHWLRNRGDTLIKVASLTLGITGCLLILLFVQHEWSYDNFHINQNIYRLEWGIGAAITESPVAHFAAENVTGVEGYVRLRQGEGTVEEEGEYFREKLIFADTNFFSVFTFPLQAGDKSSVLLNPHSIVLTPTAAHRYFGTLDVLGKTLSIRLEKDSVFSNFMVTGLTEPLPTNTTLPFEVLLPFKLVEPKPKTIGKANWKTGDVNAYLTLTPKVNHSEVEKSLSQQVSTLLGEERDYHLQPLSQVHLSESLFAEIAPPVDPRYLVIAGIVAILLLVIACINFTTLTLGRSVNRSREVGVRKTLGASRFQLVRQFLGESLLLTSGIALVSLILAYNLLPYFGQLLQKPITISLTDAHILILIAGVVLTASVTAGFYPAWVLSGLSTTNVLKGQVVVNQRNRLISVLVGLQLIGTITLLMGSAGMHQQLNLLQSKQLGFEQSYMVRLEVPFRKSQKLFNQFRNQLLSVSEVHSLTASWQLFGHEAAGVGYQKLPCEINGEEIDSYSLAVAPNFLETTQIEMVQGKPLPDWSDNLPRRIMVNESFVNEVGLDNPIGKKISKKYQFDDAEIVGIVKDFHILSLHQPIGPLVIYPSDTYSNMYVRIASQQIPATLETIKEKWNMIAPDIPFIFHFTDEDIARQYETEQRWASVITYTSLLVVFIACLGLFGMASLLTQQRTKEIGIRKVLGASVTNLLVLLSRDYLRLLVIALLIAIPIANYFMQEWLNSFAYRVAIHWWIYALVSIGVLAIALLTISGQTMKAATRNPVDSLRYE